MKITFSIFCLTVLLCSLCECDDVVDRKEVLPLITQTGANTFGCLVNGKVWVPKGNNGTTNMDVSYDPTYKGGSFIVSAYRITVEIDQYWC